MTLSLSLADRPALAARHFRDVHSDRMAELLEEAAEEARQLSEANHALGAWLSAALEDPSVCDEMKADIHRWFEVHAENSAPNHREKRSQPAKNDHASGHISDSDHMPWHISGMAGESSDMPDKSGDGRNCEYCGTTLAETGAPIWETYCPNKDCDRDLRRMKEGVRAVMAQRERAEYERLKAKFEPTPDTRRMVETGTGSMRSTGSGLPEGRPNHDVEGVCMSIRGRMVDFGAYPATHEPSHSSVSRPFGGCRG